MKEVEERARFDVDTDHESKKDLNMRIMLALRRSFFDLYEIRAVGRKNCQAAENAVEKLSRYIEIDSVIASRRSAQPILKVKFARSHRFTEVFY